MKPTMTRSAGTGLASLLFLLPLFSGCASQKQLKDYQNEVRTLREERTSLKKENRALRLQIQDYEVALAEANMSVDTTLREPQDYPELDALGVDYGMQGGDFVIAVPASITFASGKADLTKQGKEALQTVARTLSADFAGKAYWVEGHTDSDPIRKSKWGSNRELSVARAMSVLYYLVEECSIGDEQCKVAGHGQYEPVSSDSDDAGKARNRRVEIVVKG